MLSVGIEDGWFGDRNLDALFAVAPVQSKRRKTGVHILETTK